MKRLLRLLVSLLITSTLCVLIPACGLAYSGYDYTNNASLADKISNVLNGSVAILTRSNDKSNCRFAVNSSIGLDTKYYPTGSNPDNWGYQCYIYANAVYYYLFGDVPLHGEGNYANSHLALQGETALSYDKFVSAGVVCGTYMRSTANSNGSFDGVNGHSIIILSYNQSNVTFVDCNWDHKATILLHTLTWDSFNWNFVQYSGRRLCHAVIPNGNNQTPTTSFVFNIESCTGDGGVIYLRGWVYNKDNVTKSIQIHAYLDGGPGSGVKSWAIPADVAREDVDSELHIGAFHGFDYTIKGIEQGKHVLQLFANDQYLNTSTKIGDYSVVVGTDSFEYVVEECQGIEEGIHLKGWAYNKNNITNSIQIHAYLDGGTGSGATSWAIPADVSRKDMDSIYGAGEYHGFDYVVKDIRPGKHKVYLYINDQFRNTSEEVGVFEITVMDIPTLNPDFDTLPTLTLPAGLLKIESESFAGLAVQRVILPQGLTSIEDRAFSNCRELLYVNLPDSLTFISADAFTGCDSLCLICNLGSYGEAYARSQSIPYIHATQ